MHVELVPPGGRLAAVAAPRPFAPLASLLTLIIVIVAFLAPVFVGGVAIALVAAHRHGGVQLPDASSPLMQTLSIVSYLSAGAVVLWRLPRLAGRSMRELGLRRPTRADLRVGLAGIGMVVAVNLLVTAVLQMLHHDSHVQAGFEAFHPHGFASVALCTLSLVVVGPVVEECVFRAFLFNALRAHLPTAIALAVSALLFGAVHGDPLLFVGIAAVGAVLAWVYLRTGNLVTSMLVHAATNGAFLTLLLLDITR